MYVTRVSSLIDVPAPAPAPGLPTGLYRYEAHVEAGRLPIGVKVHQLDLGPTVGMTEVRVDSNAGQVLEDGVRLTCSSGPVLALFGGALDDCVRELVAAIAQHKAGDHLSG